MYPYIPEWTRHVHNPLFRRSLDEQMAWGYSAGANSTEPGRCREHDTPRDAIGCCDRCVEDARADYERTVRR